MSNTWTWPVPGYGENYITSYFGYRVPPIKGLGSNHKGMDIGAPFGTHIVAASAGKVISSGPAKGYGNWIRIDHGNGVISIYGHMQKLLVPTGVEVNAGTVIAEIGSEGNSTGPHLHFQIEVNGNPVDPLKYVSPGSTSIVNTENMNTYEENADLSSAYSLDATGLTVGQRVAGLTEQPLHAYFNIYVGDDLKLLSSYPPKPNIFQSFEYNRMQGAGETASFTLFDDNWEELEDILSNNFDRIFIEYGYYGTGLKSKLVRHRLQSYSISFESTGTILSIQSITEGIYENLKPKTVELNTYNPTDAVKKICQSMGYKISEENFDSSQDIVSDNPFNMIEEYPITYIKDVIIPQASQEGEELFTFWLDSDNYAHFKRYSYDSSRTDDMRTYIYMKGYDSPIISLTFDIKGLFGGTDYLELATGYRSSVFGTKDKLEESYGANKSTVVTTATGTATHTSSNQSNVVVNASGYSSNQIKNQIYYKLKSMKYDAYEATMVIVGDPTLRLGVGPDYDEYVRILNVTDEGYLHHTSGVYRVDSIIDSIDNGTMTTTLKLIRNAAYNIDGLEIINPKLLIK